MFNNGILTKALSIFAHGPSFGGNNGDSFSIQNAFLNIINETTSNQFSVDSVL